MRELSLLPRVKIVELRLRHALRTFRYLLSSDAEKVYLLRESEL